MGPKSCCANPCQPAPPEGHLVGRFHVATREDGPQADLHLRQTAAQTSSAASQLAQLVVTFGRNVSQGNLIDSQEVRQELCVQLVGLGAALYHCPQAIRVGEEDGALRTEQIVEPAIGSAGFDHRPERTQFREERDDFRGVFAADHNRPHDFAPVVDRRDDERETVQINTNMPHDRSPCSVD